MMDEQQSTEIQINESVEIVAEKLPEGLKAIHCNGFLTITELEELFVSLTAMGINLGNVKTFGNDVKLTAKNASIRAVSLETIGADVEFYAAANIYMPRLKFIDKFVKMTAGKVIELCGLETISDFVQMISGDTIDMHDVHTIGKDVELIAKANIMVGSLTKIKAKTTMLAGNAISARNVESIGANVRLVAEYYYLDALSRIAKTASIYAKYEPKSNFIGIPYRKIFEGDYSPNELIYLNGQLAIIPLMRNALQSPNRNIFKGLISKKNKE
jgi:hypothetical protein